jgi:hypothetical protein
MPAAATAAPYPRSKAIAERAAWDLMERDGGGTVRDVADLHVRAMAAPAAAGKRFLAVANGPTISHADGSA